MKLERGQLLLYAVTDRAFAGRQTLLEQIESALRGGATMVQLREKTLPVREFLAEAVEVRVLCRRYRVPLVIDDNVDVALESGADGVHVGAGDLPVAEIRRRAGEDFIIGATAKTVEQARFAQRSGADYLGVGAVFSSPTKRNALRITVQQLREICQSVSIPAVAIGGITAGNAPQLCGSGIAGVAVVSALFGAADVERAAAELKRQARAIVPF